MRNNTYVRHCMIAAALAFSLPTQAGITFRIYTGGPQAGEIHIDSPEGHYIYFRTDFQNDEMPNGFCGIRWSATQPDELAWYWGNPGRMALLPSNGAPTTELSYMAKYSTCGKGLSQNKFLTPSTPEGKAPPDAQLLVVEATGWNNVTFTNHQLRRLPFPQPKMTEQTMDICQRYPGFCEYSPGLARAYDDPCQHATYGHLICQLLPTAQASLIRTIDLTCSMGGLQDRIEEDLLLIYSKKGMKQLKATVQESQERMALVQYQFGQLYDTYQRLDLPLQNLSQLPFSHYAHTTLFTRLGLAKIWLGRYQNQLANIQAVINTQHMQPNQQDLKALDTCRQRAYYHLQEARFWLERQYAWVMPMER